MNEQEKINEADYHLSLMKSNAHNPTFFRYNLSAFLSSARSVLQYALEEAKGKLGGQQWYDNHISDSAVLGFFKDKRDVNIHVEPMDLSQSAIVETTDTFYVSESVTVNEVDNDGNVVKPVYQSQSQSPQSVDLGSTSITYIYRFQSCSTATGDVLTMCMQYIVQLQLVVTDGITKGFLTP